MRLSLACLAVIVAACGGSDSSTTAPPNGNHTWDVSTGATFFSPTFLTVAPGDTVRWTFSVSTDGLGHNVIFNSHGAGTPSDISGELKKGTVTRVFTTKGTFTYICTLHGSMTGEIDVK